MQRDSIFYSIPASEKFPFRRSGFKGIGKNVIFLFRFRFFFLQNAQEDGMMKKTEAFSPCVFTGQFHKIG